MYAHILLHRERVEDGYTWWAESNDLPGWSAAAKRVIDLLQYLADVKEEFGLDEVTYKYVRD